MGKWGRAIAVVAFVCMVGATACGASGDTDANSDDDATTETTQAATDEAAAGSFGSLDGVCGDGDLKVDPEQQGIDNGMLNLGAANDRTAEARPGLNKELWDSSVAFVEWCNAQGGIGGLQINLVDLAGGLFNVEAAMTTACADTFAMVGGGFVQDQLEFSGNASNDFHQCGMIDIPAFTVSEDKTGSNGMVQPNPSSVRYEVNTPIQDFEQVYPDDATSAVTLYGDIDSLVTNKDKRLQSMDDVGIDVVESISYPVIGVTDWTPYAQKVLESDAPMLTFLGEPANGAALLAKLKEQGWKGRALFEQNMYDPQLFSVGNTGPEGSVIRLISHPIEEAADWPATQQYLDLLDEYVPDHKISPLGITSMSAWLLFAVAAQECGAANDGVLTRDCVLEHAAEVDEWNGGGLHAPTDPAPTADAKPTSCGMLVEVKDGEFVRTFPEVGSEDDDIDGFHCPDDGLTELSDAGDKGKVDPSRPI